MKKNQKNQTILLQVEESLLYYEKSVENSLVPELCRVP